MNVRLADLNLFVVLDVLFQERHVTRAAARVGLTQPAMSNALDRCRRLFDDALLERIGGEMRLTARGRLLAPRIAALVRDAEAILAPKPLDVADIAQTVRLQMAHASMMLVGPILYRQIAETAPHLNIVIQAWPGSEQALRDMERGDVDLAFSIFHDMRPEFRKMVVIEERFTVIMRKGHPAAAHFDLDQWLAWPHLMFADHGETRNELDDLLRSMGRSRRVAMVAPSYSMAAALVANSDLIGLTPRAAVSEDWLSQVELLEPPIEIPGLTMHLAWHQRTDSDIAVQHVAHLIRDAFIALDHRRPN